MQISNHRFEAIRKEKLAKRFASATLQLSRLFRPSNNSRVPAKTSGVACSSCLILITSPCLQIKDKCEKLLESYKTENSDIWCHDDASTHGLATQVLLFALLFEVQNYIFF